jgi:high affinity sulfate transporter 1
MSALLFPSLHGYRKENLSGDLIAGLTVWAVLVPEALAYAAIAGVSPAVGLYAAPAALIFYAAFGSSRHLVVGPMSATAALSAAIVVQEAPLGSSDYVALTAVLALATGVVGIVAGLARLGFVANVISEPVLKGFIIGLALTIIAGQLPDFFGIDKGSGNFFEKVWSVVEHLGDSSGWTVAVGALCLLTVLALRRFAPSIPGSLVAAFIGIASIVVFNLDSHGVAIVGSIDSGLPAVGLPDGVKLSEHLDIVSGAVGVLLVGFAEGLAAAKNYAAKNGYEVDANREVLGLGAANFASGFCSGMVVNGSLSKTAVNGSAGAKTQLSGLVVAALTVLTILFLTSLFEKLPLTALAAIVIAAVLELVDVEALRRLYALRTRDVAGISRAVGMGDFLAALAAMMGVLIFDTLPGLFIGIGISLVLLLVRVSMPRVVVLGVMPGGGQFGDVEAHRENREVPGVKVLRPEGSLIFAGADHVHREVERLAADDSIHTVILELERVPFLDVTSLEMLTTLSSALERQDKRLILARASAEVRGLVARDNAGTEAVTVYPSLDEALRSLGGQESRAA